MDEQTPLPGPEDTAPQQTIGEEIAQRVETVATEAANTRVDDKFRHVTRWGVISAVATALALVLILGAIIVWVIIPRVTDIETQQALDRNQREVSREQFETLAQGFYARGQEANNTLSAFGRQRVDIPEITEEDPLSSVKVITQSIVAQTLAESAQRGVQQPTRELIAELVLEEYLKIPREQGPTLDAIVGAVLDQLPPPVPGLQGEPGEQGEPGPPPTPEEVKQAIRDLIAEDPTVLCPDGATLTPLTGVPTNDGEVNIVVCVTP